MLELHAIAGPGFGSIFRMDAASACLGRDATQSTWVVPDDLTLRPQHCEFRFEEGQWLLRPIDGAVVTVNDQPVGSAVALKTGDLLSTGASMFSVMAPARSSAPLGAPRASAVASVPAHKQADPDVAAKTEQPAQTVPYVAYTRIDDRQPLAAFFAARPGNLYAVIDTARSPIAFPLLQQCGEPHVPLFTLEGMPEDLKAYAPYLAELRPDSVLLRQLVLQGWGDHWCVYLSTPMDFESTRVHLKKFLMVRLADGREVFFRFYDPRVLRVFLPACSRDEALRFFGDVGGFYCSDAEGGCIEYTLDRGGAPAQPLVSRVHTF